MTSKLKLNRYEEDIYRSCADTTNLQRFKNSSLRSGLLFVLVFGILTFKMQLNIWIIGVLAAYAVILLLEISRLAYLLGTTREVYSKVVTQLFEATKMPELEAEAEQSHNRAIEKNLLRNGKLLAAFYVTVLFALYLLNVPYMNYFVGGATVLTVLLTLRLKIVGANSLIQYKRAIFRHGSTLEEMER